MAKKKRTASKTETRVKTSGQQIRLSQTMQDGIAIGLFVIILLVLLKPMVIDGLSPEGVDTIASRAKTHQVTEYKENTGETALWNPAIFIGMPIYHLLNPHSFSIDTILLWIGSLVSSVFIFYLFGAAGMYYLLRYMKFSSLTSFVIALLFVLLPHYQSLHYEGHFAKFKAVMMLPWILLSFKYFIDRRNITAIALFALIFGIQIRTQHYQIVFYSALMVMAVGIHPFIDDLKEHNYRRFLNSTMLLFTGLALSLFMAAQPLFLADEYLPYSKRGKTTIDINDPAKIPEDRAADGVDIEYATQWSTHPSELLTWLIPRYYGGMSGEKYTGDKIRQLRNRIVPGYWGYMPFTQSYEYIGAITLVLAAIGLFYQRRNKFMLSLLILAIFFILLSFGRHFSAFYRFFFETVPYFNKFRAPMMSVTITSFLICIFAAYGLRGLSELDTSLKSVRRSILYIFGGFIALGIILWIASGGFSFGHPRDPQQYADTLRTIRQEFFQNDLMRYFLILAAGGLVTVAYLFRRVSVPLLVLILGLISAIDLINIQSRSVKDFVDLDRLETQYFRKTATDQFIASDKDVFRILPAGDLFTDNRWGYYHETIGGYTPIKMYAVEELIENNLYRGPNAGFPVNWNILKIFNVRYLILKQAVSDTNLRLVYEDKATGLYTYLFKGHLARGYFTGAFEVIPDEYQRLNRLNDPDFDPAVTALLEQAPAEPIDLPDSAHTAITAYNPNLLTFEVFTDKQALLVLSLPYYPPGWRIAIDDQPVENIYRTNHALQSVIVPSGRHEIRAVFRPESYFRNVTLSYISLTILYLAIGVPVILKWYRRRRDPGQSDAG